MTSVFAYNFDNGTNGASVTTGLSGYDNITGSPTYSDAWAHSGTLAATVALSGASCSCRITPASALSTFYARKYVKLGTLPSANCAIYQAYIGAGVSLCSEVQVSTTGTIRLRAGSGGTVLQATSTHTFAAGDVFRIEWNVTPGGSTACRLFWGANLDGTTPDETLTGTVSVTGTVGRISSGALNTATFTLSWDDEAVDDSAWVGPSGSPAPTGLIFTSLFDNGTAGNPLTSVLTGYSAIQGGAPAYSSTYAHSGALSARFTTSSAYSYCRRAVTPGVARPYYRRYMKLNSVPSANCSVVQALGSNGATLLAEIQVTTAGLFRLRNSSSTQVAISAHTFAAGDVVRVEWDPNPGGTQTLKLFWGANLDGTTPDETLTGGTGTAGPVDNFRDGIINAATFDYWLDSVAISDTAWVGPELAGEEPGTPDPAGGFAIKVWDGSAYVDTLGVKDWRGSAYGPTSGYDEVHVWDGQQYLPVVTTIPNPSGRFPGDPGTGKCYLEVIRDNTLSGNYAAQDTTIRNRLSAYSPAKTRSFAIHRIYSGSGATIPQAEFEWAVDNGRIPLVSFKGAAASILSGAFNSNLAANVDRFNYAAARGMAVWWSYWHEPEDDFTTTTAAAQWRDADRYCWQYFKDAGCENIAHCPAIFMGDWTFNASSRRTWWWWWPDWKGTVTGGATWDNPNPADFWPIGHPNSIIDLCGIDLYMASFHYGDSISKYTATWMDTYMARLHAAITKASGGAYAYVIGETGFRVKQTGSFSNGQTGENGLGWTPGTYYEADTQAMLAQLAPTIVKYGIVGLSYWNQAKNPTGYSDDRLLFADPNEIRYKGIAALIDQVGLAPPTAWSPA